jgi:DNA-binding response OmpR family regulator
MDRRRGPAALPAGLPVHQSSGRVPDGTAQAQRQESRHWPDVVVVDLVPHDLDSVEVIRTLPSWTQALVIVLSGRASTHRHAEPMPASPGR